MVEEIAFENGRISKFQGLVTLTLTLTAYRRASLIDLYLRQISLKSKKQFLWTDGRTYGRTDGHL